MQTAKTSDLCSWTNLAQQCIKRQRTSLCSLPFLLLFCNTCCKIRPFGCVGYLVVCARFRRHPSKLRFASWQIYFAKIATAPQGLLNSALCILHSALHPLCTPSALRSFVLSDARKSHHVCQKQAWWLAVVLRLPFTANLQSQNRQLYLEFVRALPRDSFRWWNRNRGCRSRYPCSPGRIPSYPNRKGWRCHKPSSS